MSVIAESLAGKRVAITGSTGFVGTALVERMLRSVPDCELVLLVRDGKRTPAAKRTQKEILKNNAFDRLRETFGAPDSSETFAQMTDRRITTIAGDVSRDGLDLNDADRATFASCDTIIHSAAAVSFDSPLNSAVEINLLGPVRIAELCNEIGITPHIVAVSTCYVAGNRRGRAPEELVSEGPWDIGLDWRSEVASARRLKGDTEAISRTRQNLERFRKDARTELGAAGAPALAAKTEQLRERWVRADAYAYTKALGEQALTEVKGNVPVSIVRPSIIESAWAEPNPGWIRGFRMAEPVIISFAGGLLKEFPGVPEGTVDVIPVDIVVAAIIGVAGAGPDKAPRISQVASGGVNPLRYRAMVDWTTKFFTDNPLYDKDGQPIIVPEWKFPGRGRVQKQLTRAQKVLTTAEKALQTLPLRGKQADFAAELESKRQDIERALEYVELYGLYTECEAIYQIDNLLGLWDTLDADDQRDFNFDPRVVDWDHYVNNIHLPSIVQHARVKSTPGKSKATDRIKCRRELLVAGHPPPRYTRAPPLRVPHAAPSTGSPQNRSPRPHRFPAPLLPSLRERTGRPSRSRCPRNDDAAHHGQEFPRRPPPRSRASRCWAPHDPDHRRTELQRRGPAPVVRRNFRCRNDREAQRHLHRRNARRAADRRGARSAAHRLLRSRRPRHQRVRGLRRLVVRPSAV
jgi:fatty acyl-CoA reductase